MPAPPINTMGRSGKSGPRWTHYPFFALSDVSSLGALTATFPREVVAKYGHEPCQLLTNSGYLQVK